MIKSLVSIIYIGIVSVVHAQYGDSDMILENEYEEIRTVSFQLTFSTQSKEILSKLTHSALSCMDRGDIMKLHDEKYENSYHMGLLSIPNVSSQDYIGKVGSDGLKKQLADVIYGFLDDRKDQNLATTVTFRKVQRLDYGKEKNIAGRTYDYSPLVGVFEDDSLQWVCDLRDKLFKKLSEFNEQNKTSYFPNEDFEPDNFTPHVSLLHRDTMSSSTTDFTTANKDSFIHKFWNSCDEDESSIHKNLVFDYPSYILY